MKISLVIVNYKTPKLLKACLESIHTYNPEIDDIVVVDNDSGDESLDLLRSSFPEVRVVASNTNAGYGSGANWGINYAKHDTILLLNPDIEIREGSINRLYEVLRGDDSIGVVTPKLLNFDNTLQYSCFEFHKLMTPIYRRTFLGNTGFGRRELDRFEMRSWDHETTRDVGWALGGALMFKREVLEKIDGLMDERYFLYYEDVDFHGSLTRFMFTLPQKRPKVKVDFR